MADLRTLKTCYVGGIMRYPGQLFVCNDETLVKTLLLKKAVELVSIAPGTPITTPVDGIKVSGFETKEVIPQKTRKR